MYVNMDVVYFETNYRNELISPLYMGIKNNRTLFNSRNWITIASLIFNRVLYGKNNFAEV